MLLLASSVCGLFKWRQFEPEVILLAVGWYLRFSLSYRDVEELLAERGLSVDHVTIWRWVQRYAPEIQRRLRPRLRPTNDSWRVDETYIRVKGKWVYLYRAVDSTGATIDFLLSAKRDAAAAERFLARAVVKEIAKGSARIAISAWMFTCLCSRLASVSSLYSDFLGRASALPTTTSVFSPPPRRLDLPWRQSWQFCKASITPTAENAPTVRGLVLLFGQTRLDAREILSLAACQSWKTGNGL